ncbi:acyl-CoA thioesterase [Rhodococcus chondri]|uniref:Acyl-CoA thioesterase n=1 Tax=Rhodococcus chondri TaxID=3065941 RepID=A0ABU7JPJ8_9NOCA|nr:acyl-CoA thioesterase [Rhodococcus sp. CC-R104]MEE2031951.1 acyl-CoA thioesterase [Rhodococcus sp. CC-R104]
MRHDPRRSMLDRYPLRRTVTPLFGDTDALGHINNVSIARYFEQARVLMQEALAADLGERAFERAVLANIEISYLAEAFYPHDIVIGVGVEKIGTSSLVLGSALFQRDRCVALARSVDVGTGNSGGAAPIADHVRDILEKYRLDLASEQERPGIE